MYKVVLVDDDFPVRVLIKQLIDWEQNDLEIIGEAIDGEEGLEKIMKLEPDIAIVDIGMPIINGVELIKQLKERNSNCKIIVLSCHDDFQYVKQALKLGAEEYILKNLVTQEKLIEVLNNVKKEIDKEILDKQENLKIKRWANRGMWELKQEYLQQILKGIIIDKSKIKQLVEEFSIDISYNSNALVLIEIDNYEDMIIKIASRNNKKLFNFSIRNVIEEVLLGMEKGEVVDLNGKHTAVIVNFDREKSENTIRERLNLLASTIRNSINRYLDINVSIVITEKSNDLLDLFNLYEEAHITMLQKFYKGYNKIYWTDNKSYINNNSLYINDLEKNIYKYVKSSDLNSIKNTMDNIVNNAVENLILPSKVISSWLEIHIILEKICSSYDIELKEITDGSLVKEINRTETIYELRDIIINAFAKITPYFKKNTENNTEYHAIINEIIYYINSNYMKDINLSTVADRVGMNMAYVSHLFKQQVGESFVERLKKTRIEKAKNLLENTDETVNNIASAVGFSDRKYFSKTFKKVVGVNPTEYKKIKKFPPV